MINHTTKNRTHRSLKKFEEELIENGLLKVSRLSKKEVLALNLSLQDFIIKFIREWNTTRNTVNTGTSRTLQTYAQRYRSSGDIFRICKYYYPDCKFKQVLKIMDNIHNVAGVNSSLCSTIYKRVFSNRGNYYDYNTQTPNVPYTSGVVSDAVKRNPDEFGRVAGEYLKLK